MNEREYDRIYNEGAEGYNPYRDVENQPVADRDIPRLAEARKELVTMANVYARGIRTGQGAIAVSDAIGTIIAITNRRPELANDNDKELFAAVK
jgi:hypothetical protein